MKFLNLTTLILELLIASGVWPGVQAILLLRLSHGRKVGAWLTPLNYTPNYLIELSIRRLRRLTSPDKTSVIESYTVESIVTTLSELSQRRKKKNSPGNSKFIATLRPLESVQKNSAYNFTRRNLLHHPQQYNKGRYQRDNNRDKRNWSARGW